MPPRGEKSKVRSLLLLGLLVVAVAVMLTRSVRLNNIAAGSFRLDEVVLCDDIDDSMSPLEHKDLFAYGTRQVCLWFEYAKARDGDQLEVVWTFEGEDVQRESFRLVHARGTRAFYLMREDGTYLLPGSYSVSILCNGRPRDIVYFSVEDPEEDLSALSDDEQ